MRTDTENYILENLMDDGSGDVEAPCGYFAVVELTAEDRAHFPDAHPTDTHLVARLNSDGVLTYHAIRPLMAEYLQGELDRQYTEWLEADPETI